MNRNGEKTKIPQSVYELPYVKTSQGRPHLTPTGLQYKSAKITPSDPYSIFGGKKYPMGHGYRYDGQKH